MIKVHLKEYIKQRFGISVPDLKEGERLQLQLRLSVSMADPATGIDSAIGSGDTPPKHFEKDPRPFQRQTFKRICQHYVTNNNASLTPTVTIETNNVPSGFDHVNFGSYYYGAFDQGYVNIPFTNTNMAMDASDWDMVQMSASRIRIVSCGFKIKDITCCQQTVSSVGSTTQVTNQFTDAPRILLIKDVDNVLAQNGTTNDPTANEPGNCNSIILAPGTAAKAFVHSMNAGLLPKVWWMQPSGVGSTFNAELSYDLLKAAEAMLIGRDDQYAYHWENPDKNRWNGPMALTNNDNYYDETVRNTFYYNPTGTGSVATIIQQNLATDVNKNLTGIPMHHFIRVPPIYTAVGPVIINMVMFVEYEMTVEWQTGSYLTTRYIGGTDQSALAGNILPYPEFRRTMLAYAPANRPPPTVQRGGQKRPGQPPHDAGASGPKQKVKERGRDGDVNMRDQTDGRRRRTVHEVEDSDED